MVSSALGMDFREDGGLSVVAVVRAGGVMQCDWAEMRCDAVATFCDLSTQ